MKVPLVSCFYGSNEKGKEPAFKYKHELKTLYKKGKFPKVKYDFYGEKLTKENCTLEHLQCVSEFRKQDKWMATVGDNLVLATANTNQARGTKPLSEVINWFNVGRYLEQFRDVVVRTGKNSYFIGNEYIVGILKKIEFLLSRDEASKVVKKVEEHKLDIRG